MCVFALVHEFHELSFKTRVSSSFEQLEVSSAHARSLNLIDLFFFLLIQHLHFDFISDDLRTANIICDSEDGVTCLVIDRETFKQLISNLDEIRNKYNDEGTLERKR